MPSEKHSESSLQPLRLQKPATSATSGMLTTSEREQLAQKNIEIDALLQKAYPNVKILR
ncbi:MAG: hypothetical protein H8K10_17105 [Nitrospira sp.]|nr:hypothetical protein [Nitrospira sp.]